MPVTGCTAQFECNVTAADDKFLKKFEGCFLPESEWTHLAHIRVAWIYLNSEREESALARIRDGILRYNTEVLGRRHKYHETVTVAYTRIVASRIRRDEPWVEFAKRIDDLLDTRLPISLRYYSKEHLFSDAVRKSCVESAVLDNPGPNLK